MQNKNYIQVLDFIQQARQTFKQWYNQVFRLVVSLHLSREHLCCNCTSVW